MKITEKDIPADIFLQNKQRVIELINANNL